MSIASMLNLYLLLLLFGWGTWPLWKTDRLRFGVLWFVIVMACWVSFTMGLRIGAFHSALKSIQLIT